MAEWKKTTIGEHCTVTSSKRFHLSERAKSGVPFYCSKDIIQKVNGDEVTECDYISEDLYDKVKQRYGVPVAGDLLITTRGTYGVPYLYRDTDRFYFADGNLTWLKDFDDELFPMFLMYWIQTREGQGKIDAIAKGTAQKAVPIASIKNIELSLPPIAQQMRIADILSAYDALIENNQKQIKLLEEAARRLYKEWFVDLRFPGYEAARIVDGVPEGWKTCNLGDIDCKLESGSRPKGGIDSNLSDGIPSIGAENVIGLGKYNFSSEKLVSKIFFDSLKKGVLGDRDILIYKDGAYIGRTSLFQDGFPHYKASVNEHVFLLHAIDERLQYYIFFTLYQQEYFKKMQNLNKNSAQPGINSKALLSLDIIMPDMQTVEEFEKNITPLMKAVFSRAKQNVRLAETRDRMLSKLINGELEIKKND